MAHMSYMRGAWRAVCLPQVINSDGALSRQPFQPALPLPAILTTELDHVEPGILVGVVDGRLLGRPIQDPAVIGCQL